MVLKGEQYAPERYAQALSMIFLVHTQQFLSYPLNDDDGRKFEINRS